MSMKTLSLSAPASRCTRFAPQQLARPAIAPRFGHRQIVTRAIQEPDTTRQEPAATAPQDLLQEARRSVAYLARYDWLSAGLGALCVTTYCVARGQDAATALQITAASTVVALLLNDTFFDRK